MAGNHLKKKTAAMILRSQHPSAVSQITKGPVRGFFKVHYFVSVIILFIQGFYNTSVGIL
jgi:hypothetical protein